MINAMLSFLSREWAGLAMAVAVAATGATFLAVVSTPWLGVPILVLAGVMTVGSFAHLVHMARVRRRFPPPGQMVDVGGFRMHVLAEGDACGGPAVVWLPGGHAAGFAFHHLHRVLREEARSVLVDRPGTGWSDIGPFPRTTAREAEEVFRALEGVGEPGPYVLVGHSFGGFLVANMARRRPERVAALVMVDATPPDTIIYGPRIPVLRQMRGGAVLNAVPRLFGVRVDFAERRAGRTAPAAWNRITELVDERLGEAGAAMRAVESGTKAACAMASISAELSAVGLAEVAWDTVVYEGDLGDVPVLLVAPEGMDEAEFDAVAAMIERQTGRPLERDRLRRFYARSRERYLTISSRSSRVVAPAGTGHNFPYEAPEFLLDVMRSVLRSGTSQTSGSGEA